MTQNKFSGPDGEATVIMSKLEAGRCLAAQRNQAEAGGTPSPNYQILLKSINEVDWAVILIHRLLDYQEVRLLRDEVVQLLSKLIRHWVVDLSALEFCDSAILGICIMVKASVRKIEGKVTIRLVRDSKIHEAFKIARLDLILPVEYSYVDDNRRRRD